MPSREPRWRGCPSRVAVRTSRQRMHAGQNNSKPSDGPIADPGSAAMRPVQERCIPKSRFSWRFNERRVTQALSTFFLSAAQRSCTLLIPCLETSHKQGWAFLRVHCLKACSPGEGFAKETLVELLISTLVLTLLQISARRRFGSATNSGCKVRTVSTHRSSTATRDDLSTFLWQHTSKLQSRC